MIKEGDNMSGVKIINDDALEVLKQLNDGCIDLIVTDPPYKVTSRGRGRKGTTTSGWPTRRRRQAINPPILPGTAASSCLQESRFLTLKQIIPA